MEFLSLVFDAKLIPWVFVVNILGLWLKRMKLPEWAPPIPLLLFMASFVVCTLFGWLHLEVDSGKAVAQMILEYGLCNGVLITLIAIFGYDVFHAYRKKEYTV